MSDPKDYEAETVRLSLDVDPEDHAFLRYYAEYKNALARAQGRRLKRQWTRKALAEWLIATQCDGFRAKMRAMIAACGPFPQTKDKAIMDAYVQRVLAWDAQQTDGSADGPE